MPDADPLLNAAQTAFQSLLATADEVNSEARTAFKAGLKRQSDLYDKIIQQLEQQFATGGGGK